ncbi:thiamine diphosphokinase [Tepidibacter formicigenes]|uniref:Thiamine diphosphokinase n=1 Tax=Tepidibacter formicigenes DSM 15518 TaxID=1123349 RepID=A0A1M6KHS8_9FIRM|nr:thiamine diphosphokinase [Tepidibacter formicigenes]SHJ58477.1 thiamine pyrophosphokinase [Tepidibacter formicigenes DSM 15518]
MKVAIIANGEIKDYNFHKDIIKKFDYVICADGASNHAYKMKITPNIILGDLDSINKEVKSYFMNKNIKFNTFPSKKDKTDTEICIDYAINLGAREIVLLGVIGSRMDHSLANINILYYLLRQGIKASIINENNEIYITDSEIEITGKQGDIVSIIPLYNDVVGVTLKGLEYPLNNFNLSFGSSRGVSNVMMSDRCKISLKKGCLLVIKAKD